MKTICQLLIHAMKRQGKITMFESENANKNSFSVSDELSGHGIGRQFHCLPLIYHHGEFFDCASYVVVKISLSPPNPIG